MIRLQDLSFLDLQRYYRDKGSALSQTTLEHHHSVISGALRWAEKKGLVQKNVATLVDHRPKAPEGHHEAQKHCRTVEEARQFLQTAAQEGIQTEAFYTLALETGMRKGELCGLKWSRVDLDSRKITIDTQLIRPGKDPVFGPPKRSIRVVHISESTARLLRRHRRQQNEVKLKNRLHYEDHDLVFAKEWGDRTGHDFLGDPLPMNNLGQRHFAKLINKAGSRESSSMVSATPARH